MVLFVPFSGHCLSFTFQQGLGSLIKKLSDAGEIETDDSQRVNPGMRRPASMTSLDRRGNQGTLRSRLAGIAGGYGDNFEEEEYREADYMRGIVMMLSFQTSKYGNTGQSDQSLYYLLFYLRPLEWSLLVQVRIFTTKLNDCPNVLVLYNDCDI